MPEPRLTSLALLAFLLLGVPAFAEIIPEVAGSSVVGRDSATAEVVWEIEHRSTSPSAPGGDLAYPIHGPIEYSGEYFYAIRGDLMRVDPDVGVVVARQQYPALIDALEVADGELVITLQKERRAFHDDPIKVPYRPGLVPGRGAWASFPAVAFRARADVPDMLTDEAKFAEHKGKWTEQRTMLSAAEQRDPTNPLLPAYRGLAAQADGDAPAATSAFKQALSVDAPWNELFHVCAVFERARQAALAKAACAKAGSAMVARGLRPEATSGLIVFVVATKGLSGALAKAIEREDVETVARIAEVFYGSFPNVESGFMAFRSLAEWFGAQDRPELAAQWRGRSVAAANSPTTRGFWNRGRSVDLWILLLMALFGALPIAGFATGLRPAERKSGLRDWMPRLRAADLLVAGLLLAATVPLSLAAVRDITVIGQHAAAPVAVFAEGWGSPEVVVWLQEDNLESAARTELLAYAEHEHEMAKSGEPITMMPPPPVRILEATVSTSAEIAWHKAFTLDVITDGSGISIPNALPLAFPVLLLFFALACLGRATRRLAPTAADKVMWLVPGSHAGPLAAPLAMLIIAGLLYVLTPIGTILQTIAMPAFGRYFGTQAVDQGFTAMYPNDAIWAWVAVSAALLIHLTTSFIARRRAG